jgi:hypothetical protein
MNMREYADLKGLTYANEEEGMRALEALETHREAMLVDAWDALWWHQVEPDESSMAYYRRCLSDWEGDDR